MNESKKTIKDNTRIIDLSTTSWETIFTSIEMTLKELEQRDDVSTREDFLDYLITLYRHLNLMKHRDCTNNEIISDLRKSVLQRESQIDLMLADSRRMQKDTIAFLRSK